jgi:hypothetical protein
MFAQVIQGRTSNPEAVPAATDGWMKDLAPGAVGWLGTTAGVTDDGQVVLVVRFESAEAAERNAARPEQDRFWQETRRLFDDEPTFLESTDVTVETVGDPDRAGFVQVMQGQSSDPARVRELMAQFPLEAMKDFRPDILGSVLIRHDGGRWTQVLYFTSEAEAREGERRQAPPEWQATMEELMKLEVGGPVFLDLRRPLLTAPR